MNGGNDGSTTARGYGYGHVRARASWAPRVEAGAIDCWRCGERILPGQPWDLGHDDYDRRITRGPEHRHRTGRCPGNRAAGASKGNASRPRTTSHGMNRATNTSRDW